MILEKNLPNSNVKAGNSIISSIRIILEILIPLIGIFFILDIPLMFFKISLFAKQYAVIFWAATTALLFLTLPAKRGAQKNNPQWYDLVIASLALFIGLYVLIFYPQILRYSGVILPILVFFGVSATFIVLESVRRTSGWSVVSVIILFIIYAKWGYLLPGLLGASRLSWSRLFQQLLLGSEFMLGMALQIASGTVFGFIFFGVVYLKLGASDFLMDIAFTLTGKVRGGPAKVAIVSSSLFGMISGSAVANVVATGMITIPLMKRNGYKDYFAGAVEAVSSTGGQIMPPVMGAAAFVMAQFLGISYAKVAIVAIIPALLYYLALFVQVDSEAIKLHLKGVPKEAIKPIKNILIEGWMFFIPVLVLVYFLFILYQSAGTSALSAVAAAVILSIFNKKVRDFWSLKSLLDILKNVSRSMFEITVICAAAGFIIGIIAYTGLGLSFTQLLTQAAGGSLIVLALLTALASIILGMGMPTTPAYILLAVLAAPAMIRLGVIPIVAHFFVFYFGTLSMITPPVALSVYAAASISGAPISKLALQSVKLGIAGYIVPFIFLFNPALNLVSGTIVMKVVVILFTAVTVYLISISFGGYAINNKLSVIARILFTIIALVLIIPNPEMRNQTLLIIKIIGLAIAFFFVFSLGTKNKRFLKTKKALT